MLLLRDEPELLAIADAVASTQRPSRREAGSARSRLRDLLTRVGRRRGTAR